MVVRSASPAKLITISFTVNSSATGQLKSISYVTGSTPGVNLTLAFVGKLDSLSKVTNPFPVTVWLTTITPSNSTTIFNGLFVS